MTDQRRRTGGPELWRLFKCILGLWVAYLKGQFLAGLLMGLVFFITALVLGLHFWWALGLGAAAGVLQTVPTVGGLVSVIAAFGVGLALGSSWIPLPHWAFALILAGVFFILQQISSWIIEPRLIGRRIQVHPLLVLLAVLVGAALFNIVGAYLAVPVLVALREIIQYIRRKQRGLSAFPEED